LKTGNFELRTQAAVTKINLDSTHKRAKSVTYVNSLGQEMEQPASLIIVTAFPVNNVQLLLVSGIGEPYNPDTAQGTVGRNYCYHYMPGAVLFFDDKNFNRFMGAGALGTSITDFQGDNFDHGGLGFFGGATITASQGGGGPIASNPVPSGTPAWGSGWKRRSQNTITIPSASVCSTTICPTVRTISISIPHTGTRSACRSCE
jgi:gluconate 2-dehydrogenase alpha chain